MFDDVVRVKFCLGSIPRMNVDVGAIKLNDHRWVENVDSAAARGVRSFVRLSKDWTG